MGKLLLNLTLGEPLALVKEFPCFDNLIELDVLLVGSLHLGVHDLVYYFYSMQSILSFLGDQVLGTSKVSKRGGKYGQNNSTLNTWCKPRKGGILNSKSFSPITLVMV
jgi:hypothetical protein